MLYTIEFASETREHLTALTARQRALVLDNVERRLRHDAAVETRNRKPMRPKSLAGWELRVADLRVYYDVVEVPQRIVVVRAVGVKERERVRIGNRQVGYEVLQDDEDAGRR